ncbi:hypothetical protein [Nitrospina watsonii]|uniref:DUF4384 domain-containing protein n=1 Tax=Nitrospina watsonii TaxID=1323948 RepID=A0ABM9HF40_9BACT|nr:hypothetical protein [Nitrospina watsonii]CAI2718825.1 conserved exported protein of unknown function [Nitrospina watsonii]
MKTHKLVSLGVLALAALFLFADNALSSDEKVRAKIAIEIRTDDDSVWARSRDNITSEDKLRIVVIPRSDLHVYVVYSNFGQAQLLAHEEVSAESVLKLPAGNNFFQVDGSKPQEAFWVVCSLEPLEAFEDGFANNQTSHDKWEKLAGSLYEKGGMDIAQKMKKPISMAGAVRSMDMSEEHLKADLLTFSGKSVLIKRFVFDVAK